MSNISNLLLEKAASLNELANSLEVTDSPVNNSVNDTPNSWGQVKQAAADSLTERLGIDHDTAIAMLDRLENK